jgi:hypothetical protein
MEWFALTGEGDFEWGPILINYKETSTGRYPVNWNGGLKDGTPCGGGSTMEKIKFLDKGFIQDQFSLFAHLYERPLNVLEIGCGDLRFMNTVFSNLLPSHNWMGRDIEERDTWKSETIIDTQVLDCVEGPLPQADVAIARDLFIHFDNERILKVLSNLRECGAKVLISTTYEGANNYDRQAKPDEHFRPLDLSMHPFSLVGYASTPEKIEKKRLGFFYL